MKKLFSLKKKILLILIITPSIPLIIFLIVALREFINDKQAYILDSNLTQSNAAAISIKARVDLVISNSAELFSQQIAADEIQKFAEEFGIKSASVLKFSDNTFRNWSTQRNKKFADDAKDTESLWKNPDVLRANFSKLPTYGLSISSVEDNIIFSFQEGRGLGKSEPKMDRSGSFEVFVLVADKSKFLPNVFSKGANILYLTDSRGAVLMSSDEPSEEVVGVIQTVKSEYFDKSIPFGSTKLKVDNTDYNMASFSSVGLGDLYFLQLTSWRLAYSAAMKLIIKTSLLFVAIISFIIMLSMYISNQLTQTLTELTKASEKISRRDFDLKIGKKSNDELGLLATSFEKMAAEISDLLKKIEDYNKFLEQKVAERTAELFELNQLQKALMDSLEEGFMVVDQEGRLHKISSRAATNFFTDVSEGRSLFEMITSGPDQQKEISDWYSLMISEAMPFDEMADLGIKEFINHEGKYLKISYYSIRDAEGKIKFVVVVAQDQTEQRKSLIELKRKQEKIELATKVIKNRLQVYELVKFIRDSIKQINEQIDSGQLNVERVFLSVHTIKGNCLAFNFFEVAECAHKFEQELSQSKVDDKNRKQKIKQIADELSAALENTINENILFLGKNIKTGILTYELPINSLVSFYDELNKEVKISPTQFQHFKNMLLARPLNEYIGFLDDVVSDTASRQGKKVNLSFSGSEVKVIGHKLFNFFGALVHPIKNSIVHGIESSSDRLNKGKSEEGQIKITSEVKDQKLLITIQDDGAGVSIEMARSKLTSIGKIQASEKLSDTEILNMFMKAGVSGQAEVSIDSGRGVGSLSLAHEVEMMKGHMDWQTKKDQGTVLKIEIPTEGVS